MALKDQLPEGFYKLFASKYREYYIRFLLALFHETAGLYSALSLTEGQARAVIEEQMEGEGMVFLEEPEEEGENLTFIPTPARFLGNLLSWGWMVREFDERTNEYFYGFPGYSLIWLELFEKLEEPEEDVSHESMRSVYSCLSTYLRDGDQDLEILKDGLKAARRLLQLLSNMQSGLAAYYDRLSAQKEVKGIQKVLVEEMNDRDSRKYAILTSADSFYRYKEAVKERIQEIFEEHEKRRDKLEGENGPETGLREENEETLRLRERRIARTREGDGLAGRILKEFERIEVKYNQLIEQKGVFAARANARIQYLMREGRDGEDDLLRLLALLRSGEHRQEILADLGAAMNLTAPERLMTEDSFYSPREERREFAPSPKQEESGPENLEDFVVKPEYSQKEIEEFIRQNTRDGRFQVTEHTVNQVEDLEKLLLVWRDGALGEDGMEITGLGETPIRRLGYKYTTFTMERNGQDD